MFSRRTVLRSVNRHWGLTRWRSSGPPPDRGAALGKCEGNVHGRCGRNDHGRCGGKAHELLSPSETVLYRFPESTSLAA